MKTFLPIAAALVALLPLSADAQDMAVAQKWAAAKVVKYRVEGLHKARANVVQGDFEGKGDVTDRITVEFTWDIKNRKLVGPITVVEGKTEVTNLKSDGTNCGPPQLKGEYEHFTNGVATLTADLIQIKGNRIYPAASVSNYPASCSMRSVPGGKQDVILFVGIGVQPEVLAMPNMAGSPVTISADRKSFTLMGAEKWSWTYTPTLVQ